MLSLRSAYLIFQELKEIEKLMDADDSDSPIPALSRGSNPYLGGERCLLCRCVRPDPPQPNKDCMDGEYTNTFLPSSWAKVPGIHHNLEISCSELAVKNVYVVMFFSRESTVFT